MRSLSTVLAIAFVSVVAVAAAGVQNPPPPTKALDVTGKWTMAFETPMGTSFPALELKQSGEKITGSYTGRYGTFPFEGELKARAIRFSFTMSAEGSPAQMVFSGEVAADGQTMKGQATLGDMGDTQWSAKRNPDK